MTAEPQVNGKAEAAPVSAATAQPVVSALRAELRQFAGERPGRVRGIGTRAGGVAVGVECQPPAAHAPRPLTGHALAALPAPATANGSAAEAPAAELPPPADDLGERTVVTSPMVGTFYHAS